jgi:superfamily I DNA/RNA helicase
LDPDYTVGDQRFGHSQITFGDLVPFALEILDTCEVARNAVRQTYTHVFLDEFQDCTNNQFALIRAAFAGTGIRLTAVGDVKQRIMGWVPGAVEGIFATFAKEFGTGSLNLYQNFRSQPRLRRMQNAMVKVLEPAAALDDEAIQGNGGDIEVLPFDDSQQEADAVADLISNWIRDEQVPPSEIAVLISKQPEHYGELLMEELRKRQIAFRNEQKLQDLSVEPIARFIVDFLLVVRGDREPDAYGRLIGGAPWSDSEEEREVNLQGFLDEIRRDYGNHVALNRSAVRPLVDRLLETVGAQKVAALSAEYEQGDYLKKKIDETLIRINELWTKGSDVRETLAKFSEDSAVRIMTIHKSKGLEFDSVVVLGVEQEAFFGKIVDERAAFFVAISRAKRRLKLTWAKERARPSGNPYRWHTKRTPQAEFLGYSDGI